MEIKKIVKRENILKEFISIEMDSIDARDLKITLRDLIQKLEEQQQDEKYAGIESSRVQYHLVTLYKLYTPLEIHFHKMNKQR